ncbi:MAG: hypothetical protein QG566_291 [Patescibacteria group bacterium]|nr:hypothetical protein [Patescibacteria group bacterium]
MKKIFALGSLFLSILVFANPALGDTANITQINFTSSTQSIDVNTLSSVMSVQTQNISGASEQTSETNHLTLSSSSPTGEFYNANSGACTTQLTAPFQLTMSTGSANKNFCYRDSTAGTHTITISAEAQTWTQAAQDIVIVGAPVTLSSIAITTPATKLSYTVGESLDISGMIVTGTYSDNSTQTETISGSNVTGFDSSIPAVGQVLTVTVGSQTTTYTVDINAVSGGGSGGDTIFDITLKDNCEIKDTSDVLHSFPEQDSPSHYLAICALVAAKEALHISNLTVSDSNFGLSPVNIDGVEPSATEYWALWVNGGFASCGIECLPLVEGDDLTLILSDWMANTESTTIKFHIISLEETVVDNGGGCTSNCGGGGNPPPASFSTPNAVSYLESMQGSDGSFGSNAMYTDWASIALASNGINSSIKTKILDYLKSNNKISSTLTDNERRVMALLALGQNPYSFDDVNYINEIIRNFDGTQFGDINLDNDDIFGLIVLPKVGYTISDNEISKTISFILGAQLPNGSWDNSVDMTAAGIQALNQFNSIDGVSGALAKASVYIQGEQQNDGGWGNVSSTAWAMQASTTLGTTWSNNSKTGIDYLATIQNSDGGVLQPTETVENRIWATSYAIPASLNKPWASIMQSVVKQVVEKTTNNSSDETKVELKKIDETPKQELTNETPKPKVVDTFKPIPKKEIVQNTEQKQDEQTEEIVDPSTLVASATDSKTKIPMPYIFGGITLLLGAGLFMRFHNLPK